MTNEEALKIKKAMTDINNMAVSYIENGPYENDMPGMEFAVKIDQISKVFCEEEDHLPDATKMMPPMLEQLRQMDGKPAYWPEDESWGIIAVDSVGKWAGIPFFRGRKNGGNFEYDIEARGMEVYAYPPAHIDMEAWTAEWIVKNGNPSQGICSSCGGKGNWRNPYCPNCGRAMTPEARAMLEKRLRG